MNKIDEIKIDIIRRVANMSKEAALHRVLNYVKEETKNAYRGPWPEYEGFGLKYTCGQWADVSGIPRHTFKRYLNQGLTVEEIFEKRQCDPPIK